MVPLTPRPGLTLHTSNRLERLADELAKLIADPLRSPILPEIVVVQSNGMRRWLEQQIAERHGICSNVRFPFPQKFFQDLLRSVFPIKDGETFNKQLIGKGLDNLRKAYGELGYIDFTPVPATEIDDQKKMITLNIEMEEGKPYFVRRIEFQGNTTTRDRVIRRELLVQEGQVFNSRLWDISVLRLNQLNYFDALKPEDDTERKLDTQNGTVDLTVKVKEKGKNSIGLTGGVSGLAVRADGKVAHSLSGCF